MLAVLLELAICLATGAAVAWYFTSATNSFLVVTAAVACTLGVLIFLVRHGGWGVLISLLAGH